MALRFWHVTGHRHWYFYVLALVCVACWNAAVLVLPPAQTGRAGAATLPPRSSEVRESGEGRLINLTDFRYVINSDCGDTRSERKMVIVVTSNARNAALRSSQRAAFPGDYLEARGVRRVFLLALDPEVSQGDIMAEDEAHGDIVQGNFREHYRHLGYKHIMGLKWAVSHCEHARYILKSDDDILVNIPELLLKLLSDYPSLDDVALGYKQMGLAPQRNPKSKWFVSETTFAGKTFPDFLSGWAWMTSPKTAERLVQASTEVPFFWVDDVWITGMLASQAGGVALQSLNTFYTLYVEHMECCVNSSKKLCDFIIGPSMDRTDLVEQFGRHSRKCLEEGCVRRPWQESIARNCVIDNPLFLPHSPGIGEVITVPNKVL